MGALGLQAARILSSALNPLFVVLWLSELGWERRRRGLWPRRYIFGSILGLGISYIIVHAFRWLALWPGHPEFPSGHEAFAASIATSLALRDMRFAGVVLPGLAILGLALVRAHYHDWLDIAGAVVVSPLLTWLCHVLLKTKARQSTAST